MDFKRYIYIYIDVYGYNPSWDDPPSDSTFCGAPLSVISLPMTSRQHWK